MRLLVVLLFISTAKIACAELPEVSFSDGEGFPLVEHGVPAIVWVDPSSPQGLKSVAEWFAEDLERLSGQRPAVVSSEMLEADACVLVGVVGRGGLIDDLVESGKIDSSSIAGNWESALVQVVTNPFPGIQQALVVAGADKRGAIYGMLDLSRAAGVSPWHWWADVPTAKHTDLSVAISPWVRDSPGVRYRGIFLNDEAPALANWAQEKFGGCNSKFYARVFELILRLRGNFLWPAMWGRSLFDDDPDTQRLADELGVVLGTSHHEPMMRAHVEWQRHGKGPWDYSRNPEVLQQFWREGIRRMGDSESVVTLGMRGDGDEPMTDHANITLLEKIVFDQRLILAEELTCEVTEQPQVWALYKEVQDYYDRGMRVPDDVILLLCDDNWGNIRRLPAPSQKKHPGGYGMYYHFDYVGDPRNYKWLNTNSLPRVWEQMHLAWEHGVDKIWIVNVGDLKPMEQPIDFFLSLAWDPIAMPAESIGTALQEWQIAWAEEQFGSEQAPQIAGIIADYARYISRRKPELLEPETYSLQNYREWERVVGDWHNLALRAEQTDAQLGSESKAAYYQLVLHPILAAANLHDLYFNVAKNRLYAFQKRAGTNALADLAEELYARDATLTERYHHLEQGKWNHMMSQTHIGYTNWQQPEVQAMPHVERFDPLPDGPDWGIEVEGEEQNDLPEFVSNGLSHWIEIYCKSVQGVAFSIDTSDRWIRLSADKGNVTDQQRIEVSVDWTQLDTHADDVIEGTIDISSPDGRRQQLAVHARRLADDADGFVEANGYIAIDAMNYARAIDNSQLHWYSVPDMGREGSAMITAPSNAATTNPGSGGLCLEYPIHLTGEGELTVDGYLSPTLDFYGDSSGAGDHGIRFAISIDQGEPVVIDMHADRSTPDSNSHAWRERVADNIHKATSAPIAASKGNHTLKFWRIDSGIALQKIVVSLSAQTGPSIGA